VSPVEIESLLVEHPDVVDAVVVPVWTGDTVGPKIKACVTPRLARAVTEDDVIAFMRGRLAEQKIITGGVEFIDSVPRNAAGKIVRWKIV